SSNGCGSNRSKAHRPFQTNRQTTTKNISKRGLSPMPFDDILLLTLTASSGVLIGALFLWTVQRLRLKDYKSLSAELLRKGESEVETLKRNGELALKQQQMDQQKEFEARWQNERRRILSEEERLKQREDRLESRMNLVDKKL